MALEGQHLILDPGEDPEAGAPAAPPTAGELQVEDEIMEKRGQLIESLERRLAQRTVTESLFTIRWGVA